MPKQNLPATSHDPARQRAFHKVCTFYGFHRFCSNALCRRARECRGDSRACFLHWWRYFPEEEKISFRVLIREGCNGASPAEAAAKVEAALQQYRDWQRSRAESAQQAQPAEQPRREAPQPRVRLP